jgi:hypothetical protein
VYRSRAESGCAPTSRWVGLNMMKELANDKEDAGTVAKEWLTKAGLEA